MSDVFVNPVPAIGDPSEKHSSRFLNFTHVIYIYVRVCYSFFKKKDNPRYYLTVILRTYSRVVCKVIICFFSFSFQSKKHAKKMWRSNHLWDHQIDKYIYYYRTVRMYLLWETVEIFWKTPNARTYQLMIQWFFLEIMTAPSFSRILRYHSVIVCKLIWYLKRVRLNNITGLYCTYFCTSTVRKSLPKMDINHLNQRTYVQIKYDTVRRM